MKRKTFSKVLTVIIAVLFLIPATGCSRSINSADGGEKIKIVTTIFPPYDFAREIAGDTANVSMLLKPGMESHSYEPSPSDIIAVEECDLFIYNGGESDTWVDTILDTVDNPNLCVIKMLDCVEKLDEESVDGMEGGHSHTHEHENDHDHEAEPLGYDEHVWTVPLNALKISQNIAYELMRIDSQNSSVYENNLADYENELIELHNTFLEITGNSERKAVIFGDRFPFRYFTDSYGLEYRAAFPGCNAQTEPSAKTVAYLIERINESNIPNIFYIEFSNMKIAETIQEETGAIPLLFHSCHNLSKDEMDRGVTYLELMKQNAENLREALG